MNIEAINEIRKAAEAATPGPYKRYSNGEVTVIHAPDGSRLAQMTYLTKNSRRDAREVAATADMLAALDPATVLELCRGYRAWIPVSERLPKIGETVLIFIASNYQITVVATLTADSPTWRAWEGDNIYNDAIVTHWMPFPEPPQ